MRGNPEVTEALEKSPVVKKLETAAFNDPNFVNTLKKDPALGKKLHKDREVAKITVSLEKKNIHYSIVDIKQLRAAIAKAKDPAKAGKLEKLLDVLLIDKMMTLVVKASSVRLSSCWL
ncbi:hypothetical protein PR002_g27078 [Phytophthora rubi]|uniref:Uncharacterized protein n=1 Tax=Phytophthora rubi TaxID=129364 RepID=A0A6A3HJZ9_9STRA|nr:hypothetical protein PR002_g27078 [Phytophthora rubi]